LGAADWNTLSAAIKAAGSAPNERRAAPSSDPDALDKLARTLGLSDWDELVATIRAVSSSFRFRGPPAEGEERASSASSPQTPPRTIFTANLQVTLQRATDAAAARRHEYTTLEHLLLALLDDADAAAVLEACQVDLDVLRAALTRYVDWELASLVDKGEPGEHPRTAGFHRVVQRAVLHVQSAGRDDVTGANVLTAIFSERESQAASFLTQQGMTRYDAVNFIAFGIRKAGRAA
jgi:hypothetical protein